MKGPKSIASRSDFLPKVPTAFCCKRCLSACCAGCTERRLEKDRPGHFTSSQYFVCNNLGSCSAQKCFYIVRKPVSARCKTKLLRTMYHYFTIYTRMCCTCAYTVFCNVRIRLKPDYVVVCCTSRTKTYPYQTVSIQQHKLLRLTVQSLLLMCWGSG